MRTAPRFFLALAGVSARVVAALWLGPASLSPADLWRGERSRTPSSGIFALAALADAHWLVGAALGLAGAALQGLLRNPLADAGVLGFPVSPRSARCSRLRSAFPFSRQCWRSCLRSARRADRRRLGRARATPATLALIGIGLSSAAGGLIALALNLAPNPGALSDLVNWTLGSVEGASWPDVWSAASCFARRLISAQAGGACRRLDLGEETARCARR